MQGWLRRERCGKIARPLGTGPASRIAVQYWRLAASQEDGMARRVILDTDAGSNIDDLWALALVLNRPQLELLGVTTVSGDTQARARLVAKMLRLAGRQDVQAFRGFASPMPFSSGASIQPAMSDG
jgi:hypothetical protein